VPSCIECHGVGGKRRKPEYPILAGQLASYLQLQLELFQRDQRGGSAYEHLMRPTAKRLTRSEVREVALYFESLAEAKGAPRQAPNRMP
jgi:cytochrome c553